MDVLHLLVTGEGQPTSRFDAALFAARRADRLAEVFTAAYDAAVRSVFYATPGRRVALCVTEDSGNTPRVIETRLRSTGVHGTKSFVTFGEQAEELLVLASRGDVDGRKDLVIARVAATEARIEEVLRTPFMPEIAHARVVFEGSAAEVVHEDAWPRVKSFRLTEDVHVLGATLAWLFGLAVDHEYVDGATTLAPLILTARAIAERDATVSTTHLAYDGLHAAAHAAIDDYDWTAVDPEIAERWVRDRPVLEIAATARAARGQIARRWLSEHASS